MRTADCVHSLMHFLHMVSLLLPSYLYACTVGSRADLASRWDASDISFFPLQTSRKTATGPRWWSGLWWASWWPPWLSAWRTGSTWRKPSKKLLRVWISLSWDSVNWQDEEWIAKISAERGGVEGSLHLGRSWNWWRPTPCCPAGPRDWFRNWFRICCEFWQRYNSR